ncbi:proton-conducting transporter membrane subunit [Siccirubricoccus sp. G192]|uniref:proton-conducting transporter transmembrane domain-containing protein n=1 Tax=Siccirubricoccus sp. G192 TaxID=2849651 RepID=UPI001C2B8146|nr:proton-conducting transporter membrane subunit [Siccirubricoccus sp. G192]MBV1796752.1 hydrogenase 4 subunit F [Siccirubricoccus sp. G192]
MPLPWLVVFLPWAGALLVAAVPGLRLAALLNLGVSAASLVLALFLLGTPYGEQGWTRLDALNLPLVVLSFVIGFTTAIFSLGAVAAERFDHWRGRAYHAAFQVFMGAQALALLADNMGVMWVAIEMATMASVLIVAVHGTPAATHAAWKMFLICGVGITLALLGTIILYLAVQPLVGHGDIGLSWAELRAVAADCDPGVLNLAFIFLLVGYGTKAGLAPLHSWLPDAEAEGPIAISAVLSGLLLNAALHAVLRVKAIVGANAAAVAPGPFLVALGLASLLLAALALWRRRDARRFFAWSSVEHMGLAAIAFGLGGAAANFAGLLHMLGHSLCKSAVFFGVGHAAQVKGTQKLAEIGGLVASHPVLGWGLAIAIAAVAGLPPFALFTSEFLLLVEVAARHGWLIPLLGIGLLTAAAAKIQTLQRMCLGDPTPDVPHEGAWWPPRLTEALTLGPLFLHLALALLLGVALPGPLAALLAEAAAIPG